MADQKLTQLDAISSVLTTDILYVVDDPGGTPVSKKVTALSLLADTAANAGQVIDFSNGLTVAGGSNGINASGVVTAAEVNSTVGSNNVGVTLTDSRTGNLAMRIAPHADANRTYLILRNHGTNATTISLSSNGANSYFNTGENFGIGTASPAAQLHIVNGTASQPAFIAQAAAGQSDNIFEIQNSSSVNQIYATSGGNLVANNSIGIGTSSLSYNLLRIAATTDAPGSGYAAITVAHIMTGAAAAATYGEFFQTRTNFTSGTHTTFENVISTPRVGASQSVNLGSLSSFVSSPVNESAQTISTVYGINLGNAGNSGGGTITTQYGLYVGAMTSATTNYAIYTNAGTVRLGGDVVAAASATVNGDLTVDTDTLYVDSANDRVGVNTASPAVALDVVGTTDTDYLTVGGEYVTPYTGRRNLLYNGAMQVAQRGTSTSGATGAGYYTADRWRFDILNSGTWTQTLENDAPSGSGLSKSIKLLCTTAYPTPASNTVLSFQQRLEGQDLQCIAKGSSSAKSLSVSFWVKSNVTGTYILELHDGDNGRQVSKSYTVNSSDTWEYKSFAIDPDTTGAFGNDNGLSMYVIIWFAAGTNYTTGTLNTSWNSSTAANRAVGQTNLASSINNYIQITGVQLELGDKATPFEHRSYGEELALCQRYYHKGGNTTVSGMIGADNYANVSTVFFPTAMRTTPSVTVYKGGVAGQMYVTWGAGGFGNLTGWVTGSLHNYGFAQYRNFGSGAGAAVRASMDYYEASAEL